MSEVEERAGIKFSVIQGKAPELIHEELRIAKGKGPILFHCWAALFKQGWHSCEDDPDVVVHQLQSPLKLCLGGEHGHG